MYPYATSYEIAKLRERSDDRWDRWLFTMINPMRRTSSVGYVPMDELGAIIAKDWRDRSIEKGHYTLRPTSERGRIFTANGVRMQRSPPTEEELGALDLIIAEELRE